MAGFGGEDAGVQRCGRLLDIHDDDGGLCHAVLPLASVMPQQISLLFSLSVCARACCVCLLKIA